MKRWNGLIRYQISVTLENKILIYQLKINKNECKGFCCKTTRGIGSLL